MEVECSDVDSWYHFSSKGRGDPASYDELTSLERTMHGEPWMDRQALIRYWSNIEGLGIIPLVAEIEGKVVGHPDVIIADEQPLGRFLYLDVLMVHKAYRRRGVATALIREAERLARTGKVGFMMVQPQQYEGPSGSTYRSCGFEKAFDTYQLETSIECPEPLSGLRLVSIPQIQEAPIKTHAMICGWYNISAKTWDYGVNTDPEFLRFFSCHELALSALTDRSTYFFHLQQNRFDHSTGTLSLWAPLPLDHKETQDVFQAAKTAASWLGIRKMTTKTIESFLAVLEKCGFLIKSKEEPYLTKTVSP